MKLHVLSENITRKLPLLLRAVSTKTQLPVLLNFLILTQDGKLVIKSTDLEIGIEVSIPVNIEEEGGATVVARKFYDLISSLPPEKITIETLDSGLIIKTSKTKSTLQIIPAEEFPKLYEETGRRLTGFKNKDLKDCIVPVVFAASSDITRPALSGVYIKQEEDSFLLVATDGYRLSLKRYIGKIVHKKPAEKEWEKPLLVPSRLFKEINTLKGEDEEEVIFYISKNNNQILFKTTDTIIVGRLIEAEYPNYQKIIPSSFQTRVVFDREEVEKAIKIASVFAREASNVVKFEMKDKRIFISANAPSVGENIVEVEADIQGDENQIAYNARYLLDLFANSTSDQLVLEMTESLSPGVFKIPNDDTFLHLIMPIRVQS
ncbi:MAG: DNA polymerase III subunit beta [Candidatus Levybacteria bacterium RIFCSPHIGHO2_12_FULL_38_12]|nr:MAG: DNA polymerase III subunit beta [Candidatus Levybacteria bacterium RIFCSPHIGHO2_01_FULL_38_12]OGH22324.1 MAG: DNA polymerase III subunit beta [Candidatus Levybacteria bacterium RIFCSPHIGHO2_02_FULL_37_18]OGH22474.1 MAG: DNA polymerase III subunit beta [Candidatus Levybacteria bacterium RIFCSPHIGHO2_12_FULL_38_12]OGH33781.1 MAG: DNA polymerase III subunit beta [Candidatus Levybacteria bacterium RIFCSPLOWO2_01_FULL_37_20]OGH43481.1 MAG: DNA polymerase III subunit beta [Candidatus Levybact